LITFECECGLKFKVPLNSFILREVDEQICPSCYNQFPKEPLAAVRALIQSNQKHYFKVYLAEDLEIKGKITGVVTL
jgi:hypothetical protein